MTLDDTPAAVTTDPAEPEFSEKSALDAARVLLAQGDTAEDIRGVAAERPEFAYMWGAIADAMDALLGEGCAR